MPNFDNLRKFAQGQITSTALQESMQTSMQDVDDDISMFEDDPKFMQECSALVLGTVIQGMMLGENADKLDEATQNAIEQLKGYFVGQGIIDEAATIKITNPKINVVHLSKAAQIKRLTTIVTLKMARKQNHKAYKKYKLGQKIKKTNMEEMRKAFGAKAERLAKKLWARNQKSGKVNAVVSAEKDKAGAK